MTALTNHVALICLTTVCEVGAASHTPYVYVLSQCCATSPAATQLAIWCAVSATACNHLHSVSKRYLTVLRTMSLVAQAKALGDVLVVGLIPDSEILRCKGPPVLNERERYLLVDAVKWVDEVVKGEGSILTLPLNPKP